MRRAVPAIVITFVGLGALASFQTSPTATPKRAAAAVPAPSKTPPTAAPPPATGPTPVTNPPSPTTAPPTNNQTRTVDGEPVDNRYGTVQVQVQLRGTSIVGVTPVQMPFDRERSAEISQGAAPLLQEEALQAQSAQIDVVSGATYTSESYAQSLQSALDKARA